ncbi:MAG: hypothetical protein J3R72DRAFT_113279 [Linnemannia gamsii]|nr:MAG: hypothetical protein J3R72DRAFT_113279 [Linnemannia gamsii]
MRYFLASDRCAIRPVHSKRYQEEPLDISLLLSLLLSLITLSTLPQCPCAPSLALLQHIHTPTNSRAFCFVFHFRLFVCYDPSMALRAPLHIIPAAANTRNNKRKREKRYRWRSLEASNKRVLEKVHESKLLKNHLTHSLSPCSLALFSDASTDKAMHDPCPRGYRSILVLERREYCI